MNGHLLISVVNAKSVSILIQVRGFSNQDALCVDKDTMDQKSTMTKRRITKKQPPFLRTSPQMPATRAERGSSDAVQLPSGLLQRLCFENVVYDAQQPQETPHADDDQDSGVAAPIGKASLAQQPHLDTSPSMPFHEMQESGLCAMHALNNALGQRWQTPPDMEFALVEYLAEAKREHVREVIDDHVAPGGWYSSEVLAFAIRATTLQHEGLVRYQMNLQPISEDPALIHHCLGAVVNVANNDGGHWEALRSIGGTIWRHDARKRFPERLANETYLAYLLAHPTAYPIVPQEA